ncbi:hypothetical protein F2Q69_00029657 [Brassica cretica]|uniref:Uncharacterized protein n=1 Tax=Brassica cretica TaxID=69181 RepID=A0A8S9RS41_BRACR|nr:hypothetical protein F2Q69_00029657 [Brassica cretica]
MQRSYGRSDTDASTAANGAESVTEKSSLKRFTLEKGDLTHDGSFLKDFGEIGKENLCLKKEKRWLEDTVINLRKELDDERKKEANTSDLKKENVRLAAHIESLEKQVKNEKTQSSDLNAKLEHHYKTARMLTGSKELDKILSLGRQDQTSRGLGYTEYGKSDTEPVNFVPSSNSRERTTTEGTS